MNQAALLFDIARRLRQHPAVSDDRRSWNYGELTERVARIAGGLRAYGHHQKDLTDGFCLRPPISVRRPSPRV